MSEKSYTEELPGYSFEVYKGQPNFEVLSAVQVHGAVVLDDSSLVSGVSEADGIMSLEINSPMAVKTADCLPIVVIGNKGAAILHAGWRGVQQKIVQSSELLKIEPYYFYIGPHIQSRHFEVQEDFKENFPSSQHFSKLEGKLSFDLGGEISDQIKQAFPEAKIVICAVSTFSDPRFFSFRENRTEERNWNVLQRRP